MERYIRYTLRSPLRAATWLATSALHSTVLYGTHRWEDNNGMIERFRKGKPIRLFHFLYSDLITIGHDALQVKEAQNILRKYTAASSNQTQNIKSDEIYLQIRDMKRWIRELNGNKSGDPEEENKLLGIFWVARACGQLNESAQDYLLKWVREERYGKVNQYFYFHNIPLQISEETKTFIPSQGARVAPSIPQSGTEPPPQRLSP